MCRGVRSGKSQGWLHNKCKGRWHFCKSLVSSRSIERRGEGRGGKGREGEGKGVEGRGGERRKGEEREREEEEGRKGREGEGLVRDRRKKFGALRRKKP